MDTNHGLVSLSAKHPHIHRNTSEIHKIPVFQSSLCTVIYVLCDVCPAHRSTSRLFKVTSEAGSATVGWYRVFYFTEQTLWRNQDMALQRGVGIWHSRTWAYWLLNFKNDSFPLFSAVLWLLYQMTLSPEVPFVSDDPTAGSSFSF